MSVAVRSVLLKAAVPLAALPLLVVASPSMAVTPLASEAFVPFIPPATSNLGGETLRGLGGAETFDPVARAQLLARELPLNWSGLYQPFDSNANSRVELRLSSATPIGQMIDLRGELTVGGVKTPVQGNLNAESDQLDLLILCRCTVPGLEMGGVFTGLQGLQLSGWQASRLTSAGGRLDLRPTASYRSGYPAAPSRGTGAGTPVRGLW